MPKRLAIQAMQGLAESRGGKCLSDIYVNSKSHLLWQCAKGHQWTATPDSVQQGTWCPRCSSSKKTIEQMRALAAERGGSCLSPAYVNKRSRLKWQCQHGHIWEAISANVKTGKWCPVCARLKQRLTIEEMRDIASSHGGRCLSTSYQNTGSKLQWECSEGHTWFAVPLSIKQGHWCSVCAGVRRNELEDTQELARARGGECLSEEYHSNKQNLKWRCSEGHTWMATYNSVKRGRWCPECSAGLGERICRAYFEQMFGRDFPKTRPAWLTNSDGYQMELDGYCDDLALAFEHQGLQHYRELKNFFYSKENFVKRKRDDLGKKTLCQQHGITLIEIPGILRVLPLSQVQHYIIKQCTAQGIAVPETAAHVTVRLLGAYSPDARQRMEAIHKAALIRGGTCLSPAYLGSTTPLRFRCSEGHKWKTTPQNIILSGTWCPECARSKQGPRRLDLLEMQALGTSRGGQCLSDEYINANSRLLWQCKEGHQWKARPADVKDGHWCPICLGRGKTIEDMKNLAAHNGGDCLSGVYKNVNTKLLWRCQAGHKWETAPCNVLRGHWCPVCGIKMRAEKRRKAP